MARTIKIPAWRFKIPRLPKYDPNEPDVFAEMTLQEHLEELRDRILKVVIGVVLAFVLGVFLADPLLYRIAIDAGVVDPNDPIGGLDIGSPTDTITIYFKVALYIAFAITLPLTLYQLIAFLAPGLTKREKRVLFTALPFVSMLFIGGVSYAFYIAAPRALDFLEGFKDRIFSWDPDGREVVSFYLTLMMGLGLAFQLPVMMFILAKIGIVSAQKMRQWRRYSYLVLLILSAIITPSTDPFNMALVAFPLVILYEAGVIISAIFAKTGLRNADDAEPMAAG